EHVQVRRWLVKYQQVRPVKYHLCQRQPRLLPSAEGAHLLEHAIPTEQETPKHSANSLRVIRQHSHCFIDHRAAVVQSFVFLRVVTCTYAITHDHFALVGLRQPQEYTQQRGLAGAVQPNNHQALPALNLEADIAKNLLRSIALGEMLCPRHYLPARLVYQEINADTATGLWQFWHTCLERRNALVNSNTLAHTCRSEAAQLLRSLT